MLIVGGSIGGLALALVLHARGVACRVLEATAEMRPLGVGINVLPHSIRELAALGLLPWLDAVAIRTRHLTYMNYLGQPIWTEPWAWAPATMCRSSPPTAGDCTACFGIRPSNGSAPEQCGPAGG